MDKRFPTLKKWLQKEFGEITWTSLFGMSGSSTFHIRTKNEQYVLKEFTVTRENEFYKNYPHGTINHSLRIPKCHIIYEDDQLNHPWGLLEYIPHPLPMNEWNGTIETIHYMKKLHQSNVAENIPNHYLYEWPKSMNELVFSSFKDVFSPCLQEKINLIQSSYQHLFEPIVSISGDTTPMNFARSSNGELVLFDWQRISKAHPAMDLGIHLCATEDIERASFVAEVYEGTPNFVCEFANEIIAASLYNRIQFLYGMLKKEIHPPMEFMKNYPNAFSAWATRATKKIIYSI